MIRPEALVFLLLTPGCDVSSVVGHNASPLPGASCAPGSPLPACDEAACVVREIGSANVGSTAVGVDDSSAYFMRTGAVLARVPVGGGEAVDLANDLDYVNHLVVDATHVYWSRADREVWRVPKGGGAAELVMDVQGHPNWLALDATFVYATLTDTNQVVMGPKEPGKLVFLSGQELPYAMAADGTHVYWLNQGNAPGTGQVVRAPLGDIGHPEVLLSGQDSPVALAVGATDVYFAAGGKLLRLGKAGGAPETLHEGLKEPKDLVAFSDSAYLSGMDGLLRHRNGETTVLDTRPILALAAGCAGVVGTVWFEPELVRYSP